MDSERERPDIARPLGLDRTPRRRPALRLPGPAGLLAGVLALVILGGSTAISLRERPFRAPAGEAVETRDEESGTGESGPGIREPATRRPDGPSIVRVGPGAAAGSERSGGIVISDPSALGRDLRVAHLPDRALLEEGEAGLLPVRAADGRRPFDVYARPWSGARGARVAIVIGGLAVSQTGTQAAIESLPAEVTLAFASGGNSIDRWMQAARRKGHEIVMQVPLEPFDYPHVDPGRNTLTVEADAEDNIDRLHWVLSRTTNYTGVMNYMGARFMADEEAMEPMMRELAARGLLFLDDGSTVRSAAEELAASFGVPHAAGDIWIDESRARGDILARLDDLERTARARGYAIGVGSAFDTTVDAVTHWVAEARRRGIEIVPVSALAHDPERASR